MDGFEESRPAIAAPKVSAQSFQRGMTGPGVKRLQQRLVAAGFMSNADVRSGPGVFGPRTEAAVRRLQAKAELPVNGIAGPGTLAALAAGLRAVDRETQQPAVVPVRIRQAAETLTDEITDPVREAADE